VTHRPTVVITGSGTVTCQSVIKGLRTQSDFEVEIVTVDAADAVAGRYFSDAFYRVPPAGDPAFVDALVEVCRRHQADLLIPIVDYEFAPISRNAGRFRDHGCLVAISPPETIARVNDKLATYRFFLEHGFPTAQTWDAVASRRDIAALPYPVFLKPALDGRSSIDCYMVETPADLELYLDKVPDAMIQEFVDGPEFTADVLADWNSDVLGIVVRERIETKGGVSYKGRTVDDPEMTAHVVRMAKLLNLKGPANIQAFRGEAGLFFNEINPRFSGALALSLAAGLNSPLLLLKLALGIPVEAAVGNTRIGVTMLRYWDEVFVGADGRPEYPDYHLAPAATMAGAW
jgi:carbamoyl-phosphate synthase large subunit